MDELLRAWETTFGCSTLPFGVAEVLLDDRGRPYDFAYRYINAAAAALTGHVTEDLLGEEAYALWAVSYTHLRYPKPSSKLKVKAQLRERRSFCRSLNPPVFA